MPELRLPPRLQRQRTPKVTRSCPAHRAWVRRHRCCVPGCSRLPIECAHVRLGTNGGMGLRPSDKWVISLCVFHHAQQHRLGEKRFECLHRLDLASLAQEFARRSPHWRDLQQLV